jgi:hypothetical protein
MTRWLKSGLLAVALATSATPALAAFHLVPAARPFVISRAGLVVTPSQDWNELGARVGRNAESWTLDGLSLNDLTFYGGIADGHTLFREINKKEKPLPRYSATMLPPDIVQLFEGSYRIANNTSLFAVDSVEPARFAGHDGFRFTYTFSIQDEDVKRSGEAIGAMIDGKLYMITFEAPVLHYFAHDVAAYHHIVDTAQLAASH